MRPCGCPFLSSGRVPCARNAHRKSRKRENHTEVQIPIDFPRRPPLCRPPVFYIPCHFCSFRSFCVRPCGCPFLSPGRVPAPGTHTEKAEKGKTTQNKITNRLHPSPSYCSLSDHLILCHFYSFRSFCVRSCSSASWTGPPSRNHVMLLSRNTLR